MSNQRLILEGCLTQFKNNNQLSNTESEVFELFCATQITKYYNLSFEEIEDSIVDGSNDGGVDLFLNLINDEYIGSTDELSEIKFNNSTVLKVFINQSKKENSFKELVLDKLLTSFPVIFDLSVTEKALTQRFNPDLIEKILLFRELWRKTVIGAGKVFIYYNYSCLADSIVVNSAFNHKTDQLKRVTEEKVTGAVVALKFLSCEELLTLYQKQRPNRLELHFKETPATITFGKNDIGYIGTVKISNYLNFIKDDDGNLREDLFESNIRHYQGEVDVNKKIKLSLETDRAIDFWWLNNGITIIASKPTQVAKTLSIEDIQIVNGLQTSYTIGNYGTDTQNDERSVLVKVIINTDKETVDKIISATNSQNAVSSSLLRATDNIQRELEVFFLSEGYFYDRRKNYYKNQGKPAKKIFGIQFTAQAIQTILNNDPASARAIPTTLIKSNTSYEAIFNRQTNFKSYLRAAQLVQKALEFYSSMQAGSTKTKIANFKLHVARAMTSIILNKPHYSPDDLIFINPDTITLSTFNSAIGIVEKAISSYQADNQTAVITNIAKTLPFNLRLIETISRELTAAQGS